MSTAELKSNIINQIQNLKEIHVIEEIQRLLDFELENGAFVFSAELKDRISKAQSEIKEGKILSEKQANDEIESWLNEK